MPMKSFNYNHVWVSYRHVVRTEFFGAMALQRCPKIKKENSSWKEELFLSQILVKIKNKGFHKKRAYLTLKFEGRLNKKKCFIGKKADFATKF